MDTKSPCVTCNKKFSKDTLNSNDGQNCGRCFKKKYKKQELQLSAYKKENAELRCLNEIKREGRYYEGHVNRDGGNSLYISGQGKYTNADGHTYEGDWEDGRYHGQGKYTNAEGNTYDGEYKVGKRHGHGKYTYTDAGGSTYDGDWESGKKHGHGKYTSADGSTYDGDWESGKKHGYGVQTKDGKETIGLWEYDKFKEEVLEKLTCELCLFRQKDIACSNCDKVVGCVVCCQKIHNDTCPNCRDEPWMPRKILY